MTAARTYDDWFRMLDGKPSALPASQVGLGFYARREIDGETYVGIAVYEHGGVLVAKVGKAPAQHLSDEKLEEKFSWNVMRFARAVTEDAYRAWAANGTWPEGSITEVRNGRARTVEMAPKPAVSSGSNSPAEVQISESIADLKAEAEAWLASIGGEVTTQEQADKASNFASRFADLEKEAESARTAEKKPVLEQGKAIDGKWKTVVEAGDKAKRWAKNLLTAFLKAEQARVLKEAAERAAAGETVRDVDTKVKAGTRGRATALRTHQEYRCTDYMALFAHYRDDPRFAKHPFTNNAIAKLADADLRAGHELPGAHLETVSSAA